jgi:hypothetical protein
VSDHRDPSCRSPSGAKRALGPDLLSVEESSKIHAENNLSGEGLQCQARDQRDPSRTYVENARLRFENGFSIHGQSKMEMFMVSLFKRHPKRTVLDFRENLSAVAGSPRGGCGIRIEFSA